MHGLPPGARELTGAVDPGDEDLAVVAVDDGEVSKGAPHAFLAALDFPTPRVVAAAPHATGAIEKERGRGEAQDEPAKCVDLKVCRERAISLEERFVLTEPGRRLEGADVRGRRVVGSPGTELEFAL